jgi:hypothetical protein
LISHRIQRGSSPFEALARRYAGEIVTINSFALPPVMIEAALTGAASDFEMILGES